MATRYILDCHAACDECAHETKPIVLVTNHFTNTNEAVCLSCLAALSPSGCFDKPVPVLCV